MKSYTVKIYTLAGALVRVIPSSQIMGGLSWTEQINGGQGELRLKLNLVFNTSNLAYNNIVKIYQSDEVYSPSPRLIYTGIIGTLRRVIDSNEYIEVRVLGVASILSWLYYTSASAYTFNKSQAQETTMKDIIDIFSAQYPGIITYTSGTSVEVTGSTANIAFAYDKCLDALKKVADTLQWYWTIDGSGVLQFHPNTGGASPVNHYFTIGKDIDSLEVEEKGENIVNKYMLKYASGTQPSSDATSQTANGLRELFEDKTSSINDVGTATTEADNYIAKNKDVKKRIVMVINSNYNIETVHPGNLVTVRNLEYSILALKVVRTEYSMDKLRVELEESRTFSEQVFS